MNTIAPTGRAVSGCRKYSTGCQVFDKLDLFMAFVRNKIHYPLDTGIEHFGHPNKTDGKYQRQQFIFGNFLPRGQRKHRYGCHKM